MCSYTLQDHSQRECTTCSRQSACDKSEGHHPSGLHPISGNIYNTVRTGPLYLLCISMKYSYLQMFILVKDTPRIIWQKKRSSLICKGLRGFWCVCYTRDPTQTLSGWAGQVFGSLLRYKKFGNKPYQ